MKTPLQVLKDGEERFEDAIRLVQADKLLHPRQHMRDTNSTQTTTLIRAMIAELEGEKRDYEVQSDGQYHFGENQKTTGYNQALETIIEKHQVLLDYLERV